MNCKSTRIPYRQTRFFTDLVQDYVDQSKNLTPFYTQPVSHQGVRAAIAQRKATKIDRKTLAAVLQQQYAGIELPTKLKNNLLRLEQENCFTITTAHQNNLFTGPLYVVYKILHVIKLAAQFEQTEPGNHFVPVFYMGSEDADLAELDHTSVDGVPYQWKTNQTGAIGRMKVDEDLMELKKQLQDQLHGLPNAEELIHVLQESYQPGKSIAEVTFMLLHHLYGKLGLVVLIPDHALLKAQFKQVIADELLEARGAQLVKTTTEKLIQAGYPVQVKPRPLNLFYLTDQIRQRIEKDGAYWWVQGSSIRFDKESLLQELEAHPERFSPNVILRGLFQCSILPDVVFVGGGAELAYWLEFSELFAYYQVPLPVLVLRNSFLLVESAEKDKLNQLHLSVEDLFLEESTLIVKLLTEEERLKANLSQEKAKIQHEYDLLAMKANSVDPSLQAHVTALGKKSLNDLEELQKKLIRSLKRKHLTEQNQLSVLKQKLFPSGSLQERHDNILYFLAKYGMNWQEILLEHSLQLEQEFTVLEIA